MKELCGKKGSSRAPAIQPTLLRSQVCPLLSTCTADHQHKPRRLVTSPYVNGWRLWTSDDIRRYTSRISLPGFHNAEGDKVERFNWIIKSVLGIGPRMLMTDWEEVFLLCTNLTNLPNEEKCVFIHTASALPDLLQRMRIGAAMWLVGIGRLRDWDYTCVPPWVCCSNYRPN